MLTKKIVLLPQNELLMFLQENTILKFENNCQVYEVTNI